MKNRSELREIIMKVLYQISILEHTNLDYNIEELIKEQLEVENEFVTSSVYGVLEHKEEITKLANQYLENWTLDRLNQVDQAIICLAIYELKYTDTPSIVVINEAVELSKKYSDEKVTKVINAILDGIYHDGEQNDAR